MVRFRGARKKGAMVFLECLGVSREDTMEGPLWMFTLDRNMTLVSHGAAEFLRGMCSGNGCQQATNLHAISCTKTVWSYLAHNRVIY